MSLRKSIENKEGIIIGMGVFAGFLSSLCCIGPLVLTILGFSGAAVLTRLDVFRMPLIVLVVILFLFAGYFLIKKRNSCIPGSFCSDPKKYRKMLIAYWVGLTLAILGLASPNIIAMIF